MVATKLVALNSYNASTNQLQFETRHRDRYRLTLVNEDITCENTTVLVFFYILNVTFAFHQARLRLNLCLCKKIAHITTMRVSNITFNCLLYEYTFSTQKLFIFIQNHIPYFRLSLDFKF